MIEFPIPSDERRRLRVLERLGALDAPADGLAEAVAASAASIAGAPMGAVTLVGRDAMLVKAGVGLSTGERIPRADAFCSHTVMGAAPLVIPNLLLDPRFVSNPLVVGSPHARFYAGFPLVVDGRSIGAVCVVDDRPRTLTDDQIARLKRLAHGAPAWLELRQAASKAGL